MTLLSCQGLSKSFGSRILFKEISFGIFAGDKIGLIGPNGSGKSTLLKILSGFESPDEGNVVKNRSLRIGYIPQETVVPDRPIQEILIDSSLYDFHHSPEHKRVQAEIVLSKMGFRDGSISAESLSGGWKKRL